MQLIKTNRTIVTRTPERASYDTQLLYEIIAEAMVGHVSFYYENSVHSIPLLFWRLGDYLYCHCSSSSRLVTLIENDVCISFTIVDGLVLAKSAFRHSVNYRSAVVYGQFESVHDDAEKLKAMKHFMNSHDEKRWDRVRPPSKEELNLTTILKISLKEAVVKTREGPPNDKQEDLDRDVWSGTIPRLYAYGEPEQC